MHAFSRTEMAIGTNNLNILKNSTVVVLGIGGVGSYVVEALVRAGVGRLVLCDGDEICLTNINRQIHATSQTVGQVKVEAMKDRIISINPEVKVTLHPYIYNADSAEKIIPEDASYVVDAIDMVASKLHLVQYCLERKIPLIASMGTGNKLNPTMLEVSDIKKTSVCPLAKVMRKELKKRGIKKLKVVYSKEVPRKPLQVGGDYKSETRRPIPGSVSFVPSVAGLIIASEVVKDLIDLKNV